jgi:hypothetical protein
VCVAERQGAVGGSGGVGVVPLDRGEQGGSNGTGLISGVAVVAGWESVKVELDFFDFLWRVWCLFGSVCVWLNARGRWVGVV